MLQIARVTTELDVLPSSDAKADGAASDQMASSSGDPRARQEAKQLIREVLNECLRELERQGIV